MILNCHSTRHKIINHFKWMLTMRVTNRLIALLLSLFITTVYSAHTLAQEKITIAVGDWPPYLSQDQKHNGIVAHLITDIFSAIGIDATITFFPWTRAYNRTRDGRFAATAIWMEKEERKADFLYSDPVLVEEFVFFHKKDSNFDWSTINDLAKLSMGGIYAYSYGPQLDKALSDGKILIDRVNRPNQNFKRLLKNRIDLFPFELNVGKSILKKQFSQAQQQQLTYHAKPYLNNSSFVLFPKSLKTSPALMERFNQQLKKIKDSGEYDDYFKNLKQGYYDISQLP